MPGKRKHSRGQKTEPRTKSRPENKKQSRGQKTEPRTKSRPENKKQQQVVIIARGRGGGKSYFHGEIFKRFETARNAAKLVIL